MSEHHRHHAEYESGYSKVVPSSVGAAGLSGSEKLSLESLSDCSSDSANIHAAASNTALVLCLKFGILAPDAFHKWIADVD